MSTLLYGRPPVVFDPPSTGAGAAIQVSPLIPGSTALEAVSEGSVDEIMIYAPPGVLERRHVLALALRALKVGGRLDVMALKDKGGSRLKKELTGFGVEVGETAKAHHRRCVVIRPEAMTGIDAAIAEGAARIVPGLEAWSQPGIFAWDRIDPGTALLADHTFVVATDTPQFFSSVVGVVALLEALLSFMVADSRSDATGAIAEFHEHRRAAGVYVQE